MRVRTVWTWGAPIVALLVVAACAGDSNPTPTGVSSLPSNIVQEEEEAPESNSETTPPEEFNCTNVEIVRARFSQPGYVEHNKAGLYVFFRGIHEGEKRLRIWWNYLERRDVSRDVRIESGEESFEDVLEHVYEGLTELMTFVVRVQVMVDGLRGECARNREVDVRPPPSPSGGQAPPVQTAFVGPTDNTFGDVSFGRPPFYTDGLEFTVFRTMTLRSVKVYPNGIGTLVIQILDAGGSPVGSSSTIITESGEQRVPVGLTLLPGDYKTSLAGTTLSSRDEVGRNFTGATYPYIEDGVVSITGVTVGSDAEYHYLYNWEVSWQ